MTWLTEEVVSAVCRHMNEDHAADLLVMVGRDDVATARVTGLDPQALHVVADLHSGATEEIALPWPGPLRSRADIRTYVVEMHNRASRGDTKQ